ncbi:MAG: hypothetical protein LC624_06335 [Halobacteriales archaeon]|nr:hypothetical protein [Halobacteriales archaeon]
MRRSMLLILSVVVLGAAGLLALGLAGTGDITSVSAVTSNDMSHGEAQAGFLDPGDLIGHQHLPSFDSITAHYAAQALGKAPVAGDQGDVLQFWPNGKAGTGPNANPVEHRAIAWVAYDAATGLFDVPELGLRQVRSLDLPSLGAWDASAQAWVPRTLHVTLVAQAASGLSYPAGQHSGWLTKGDALAQVDQDASLGPRSELVAPGWVAGKVVRVVDAPALGWQLAVGIAASVLIGVAALLFRGALRHRPGRTAHRKLIALGRAACEACGTAWSEVSFCLRCGAERFPKTRYAVGAVPARRDRRP